MVPYDIILFTNLLTGMCWCGLMSGDWCWNLITGKLDGHPPSYWLTQLNLLMHCPLEEATGLAVWAGAGGCTVHARAPWWAGLLGIYGFFFLSTKLNLTISHWWYSVRGEGVTAWWPWPHHGSWRLTVGPTCHSPPPRSKCHALFPLNAPPKKNKVWCHNCHCPNLSTQ